VKDDVREVRAGMECGIRLEGFEDVHEGDVIETYEILKIARSL
jgi:translation initiation factor IF-2